MYTIITLKGIITTAAMITIIARVIAVTSTPITITKIPQIKMARESTAIVASNKFTMITIMVIITMVTVVRITTQP